MGLYLKLQVHCTETALQWTLQEFVFSDLNNQLNLHEVSLWNWLSSQWVIQDSGFSKRLQYIHCLSHGCSVVLHYAISVNDTNGSYTSQVEMITHLQLKCNKNTMHTQKTPHISPELNLQCYLCSTLVIAALQAVLQQRLLTKNSWTTPEFRAWISNTFIMKKGILSTVHVQH